MKRTMTILALLAAAALLTAPAQAGLFKKDKHKKAEPEKAKAWRYDQLPSMSFHKGQLANDGLGLWRIGDVKLQLAPQCEISGEGGGNQLQTGRTAIVMGPRVGDTIVAWRVEMQKPQHQRPARNFDAQIEWSESDPTVGVGTAPN